MKSILASLWPSEAKAAADTDAAGPAAAAGAAASGAAGTAAGAADAAGSRLLGQLATAAAAGAGAGVGTLTDPTNPRWCKKCKLVFDAGGDGAQPCPATHANFHYTKTIPAAVVPAEQPAQTPPAAAVPNDPASTGVECNMFAAFGGGSGNDASPTTGGSTAAPPGVPRRESNPPQAGSGSALGGAFNTSGSSSVGADADPTTGSSSPLAAAAPPARGAVLLPGQRVKLHSLTTQALHNGKSGAVEQYDAGKDRYLVTLDGNMDGDPGGGGTVAVKLANLSIVIAQAGFVHAPLAAASATPITIEIEQADGSLTQLGYHGTQAGFLCKGGIVGEPGGYSVCHVTPGQPAELAGVASGMALIRFNGKPMDSMLRCKSWAGLTNIIQSHPYPRTFTFRAAPAVAPAAQAAPAHATPTALPNTSGQTVRVEVLDAAAAAPAPAGADQDDMMGTLVSQLQQITGTTAEQCKAAIDKSGGSKGAAYELLPAGSGSGGGGGGGTEGGGGGGGG
eukprot:SAG22_NODE_138_length_18031_cov_5.796621_1_plen_506_part_10